MFIIFATKPLCDRTKGFRFNVLGVKGLTRKRKLKSRGWHIHKDNCMTAIHMGKRSVYIERNQPKRKLHHFAG